MNNFDTIIKERMLRNLKKDISDEWGLGDDGEKVLKEIYLTPRNGCVPEHYLGDDPLLDIQKIFYSFLDVIRNEFEPFIEIYVMPSYDDITTYFLILDDKLLYRDSIKAWNFSFESEEHLVDQMYRIYRTLLSKTEKTYECYTLMDADIQAVADEKGLSLDLKDLDDVIHYIKKGISWALDNRDEIIADAIKQARYDPVILERLKQEGKDAHAFDDMDEPEEDNEPSSQKKERDWDLAEPVEISMRYFYIRTGQFEQFLTEINKLCEKFAVKNERQQPDFSYDWDAI